MKNILQKKLKTLFTVLLVLFTANNLQAQTDPTQLWGYWDLETVELTKHGVTEKYSIETLLLDLENLPRNMFTQFYFFSDQIGVSSTEEIFLPGETHNHKGSFTTEGGKLLITLRGEQPRIFTYLIEDDLLKIEYTQEDVQFHLVYKLTLKNVE